jgi:GTP-binding protein YchF
MGENRPFASIAIRAIVFSLFSLNYCHAYSSSFGGTRLAISRCQHFTYSPRWTMKVRVGILGLPNVGKSTLFNALAQQSIDQAANFPFCTIDPNFAQIAVPDPYLESLGNFAKSSRRVPATMEWVDVAGLAKGAHRGEGLGNRFLGTLRDCQAVCHVVRAFEDPNVVHVDGKVEPGEDIDSIQLELLFADMGHVERRLEKTNVPAEERAVLERIADGLERGIPARALGLAKEEEFFIKSMGLLTLKPVMYAVNVDEVDYVLDRDEMTKTVETILQKIEYFDPSKDLWTIVSAKVEAELSILSELEQMEFLSSLGVVDDIHQVKKRLSYNVLPSLAQQLLGLSLVYTGPGVSPERSKTTRAHLFSNLTAEGLAGRLHGDIEKGFIRAEVASAPTILNYENYVAAKEAGSIRTEGREYELQSNDVVLVKWK